MAERGLEQRTGVPKTFSISTSTTAVPQAQGSVTPQQLQFGVTGSTAPSFTSYSQGAYSRNTTGTGNKNFDLLLRLGQDYLKPHVEKAQTQAFYEGIRKAASGQTMAEIVGGESWMSKIFGDSNLIEGARIYSAQAQSNKWDVEVLNKMNGDWKAIPPDLITGNITGLVDDYLTGDAGTDTIIQQNVVKKLGTVFKAHTAAHYEYRQTEMYNSSVAAQASTLGSFQSVIGLANQGKLQSSDVEIGIMDLLNIFQPVEGQDKDSHLRAVTDSLTIAAQEGNFHGISLLLEHGDLPNLVGFDNAAKLTTSITKLAKEYKTSKGMDMYQPQLALFAAKANTGEVSAADTYAMYRKINEEYKMHTGSPVPLIDAEEAQMYLKNASVETIKAFRRLQEEEVRQAKIAITDNSKEDLKRRTIDQARLGLVSGLGYAVFTGEDRQVVDNVFMQMIQGEYSGEKRIPFIVQNFNSSNYVNPILSEKLQSVYRSSIGEQWTEDFERSYQSWKQIYDSDGGAGTAMGYFGTENSIKLQKYHELVTGGQDKYPAFKSVFSNALKLGDVDDKSKKQIIETIQNNNEVSFWNPMSRTVTLSESSKNVIASYVGKEYKLITDNITGVTQEKAVEDAYRSAIKNGLEIYDGIPWQNLKGQQSVQSYTNIPNSEMGPHLKKFIADKFKGITRDTQDEYLVYRLKDDAEGNAVLYVVGSGNNAIRITSKEITDAYKQIPIRKAEKQKQDQQESREALRRRYPHLNL